MNSLPQNRNFFFFFYDGLFAVSSILDFPKTLTRECSDVNKVKSDGSVCGEEAGCSRTLCLPWLWQHVMKFTF